MTIPLLGLVVLGFLLVAWGMEFRHKEEILPTLRQGRHVRPVVLVLLATLLAIPPTRADGSRGAVRKGGAAAVVFKATREQFADRARQAEHVRDGWAVNASKTAVARSGRISFTPR